MSKTPHFDKPRPTPIAEWLTQCRLRSRKRQSDLLPVLAALDPRLGNQGRLVGFETGKRIPAPEVVKALYAHFRDCLGDTCPPPPSI